MGHEVNPKMFRIKETNDWDSRGFYQRNFPQYLEEDLAIREFLKKKIGNFGVEKVEIERYPSKINIAIFSARPGLIIGRKGEGAEVLKKEVAKIIKKKPKPELRLEIKEVKNPWSSAPLAVQWMAEQVEKRVRYRRVLKQTLSKITTNKEVKGARVQLAGRLDGIEIARTEWLKKGRLPRQTLRADIDYAQGQAYCTYGVVGIKVWIYKGDKFV
ncbi:MAG: 30S ribosomal protein S3 [Candidatus Nealsonbacteria bacterium CG08_land_8_20_14_0_20_38_20]|uniref:Small ribosomal subunit protein uS3 n=1 Tax=Candidatus Nealsonbacteria bacterium CG08_land_8_20_14_0_20_38_20 TaxID=1974705 RepID=A0A2H0YLF9_9BACT|nr:MAG: 30S ribosomal protein S3 [Candidatus Nealsonbacteria bacterium CG08_land_8_20_14_0_20_38_20]